MSDDRIDWAREGWAIEGPDFKTRDQYLDKDGTNPEAPSPGYGWPLGTECWFFFLRGHGLRCFATGTTVEKARERAVAIMESDDPARFAGIVRGTAG